MDLADSHHDHEQCVDDALSKAAVLCTRRGARLTRLRRRVLELVWQGHAAVKAYDILHELGSAAGTAKPPTVYRALDFLMAHGLVHRLESLNAYVGCPDPDAAHEGQFLICDACGAVSEFEARRSRRRSPSRRKARAWRSQGRRSRCAVSARSAARPGVAGP